MLKPVLAKVREEVQTPLIYFDDSLIQGDTRELCEEAVALSAELFDSLGLSFIPGNRSLRLPRQLNFLLLC